MSLPNIPIVSLDDIRSNDPIRQARATQALKLGFGTFGLVYVSDHDVTPAQQDRFYRLSTFHVSAHKCQGTVCTRGLMVPTRMDSAQYRKSRGLGWIATRFQRMLVRRTH